MSQSSCGPDTHHWVPSRTGQGTHRILMHGTEGALYSCAACGGVQARRAEQLTVRARKPCSRATPGRSNRAMHTLFWAGMRMHAPGRTNGSTSDDVECSRRVHHAPLYRSDQRAGRRDHSRHGPAALGVGGSSSRIHRAGGLCCMRCMVDLSPSVREDGLHAALVCRMRMLSILYVLDCMGRPETWLFWRWTFPSCLIPISRSEVLALLPIDQQKTTASIGPSIRTPIPYLQYI